MKIKQENGRTTYNYSIKEKEDVDTMVSITYVGDLQDFLKINYLANEVSFINHKLSKVKQAITELKPIVSFGDEPYYEEHMESMESEVIKTKEGIRNLYWWSVRYESFLNDRLQELNQPQQPEPEPFDLSDTSTVEKIIYLNELGIIDFLRTKPEFIGSTNLMATVLSAITGIKATTLQPSLNRLTSNDTADKNHPYRTKKTVDKVRQTLIDKNIKPKAS